MLGRAVRRDLTRVVNKLFPQGSQPDPLDREAAEHEAFARSRAVVEVSADRSVGVYIGRQAYFDLLSQVQPIAVFPTTHPGIQWPFAACR